VAIGEDVSDSRVAATRWYLGLEEERQETTTASNAARSPPLAYSIKMHIIVGPSSRVSVNMANQRMMFGWCNRSSAELSMATFSSVI